MQIGIFETEHFEAAYPVIRFFDTGQHSIVIFVYEEAYLQLRHLLGNELSRFQWVIKSKEASRREFVQRIYRECLERQVDLLFLNTVSDNFHLYARLVQRLPATRVILTLHNINNFFRFVPAFSLRRWVRYIGKQWLLRAIKEFNVIAPYMVPYLQQKLPSSKKVYNIPGGIFTPAYYKAPAALPSLLKIVVPGSVDPRRRHYQQVFTLLESARHLPLQLTLLGSFADPYGQTIRQTCLQNAARYPALRFYEEPVVAQAEFDRVMQEAHLVWIPSVIETVLADGVPETYGLSTTSGNIFDIIKNARPFLAPAALQIPAALESSAIRYQEVAEIIPILEGLLQNEVSYDALTAKALLNSQEFTIEKVRARYPDLLS